MKLSPQEAATLDNAPWLLSGEGHLELALGRRALEELLAEQHQRHLGRLHRVVHGLQQQPAALPTSLPYPEGQVTRPRTDRQYNLSSLTTGAGRPALWRAALLVRCSQSTGSATSQRGQHAERVRGLCSKAWRHIR